FVSNLAADGDGIFGDRRVRVLRVQRHRIRVRDRVDEADVRDGVIRLRGHRILHDESVYALGPRIVDATHVERVIFPVGDGRADRRDRKVLVDRGCNAPRQGVLAGRDGGVEAAISHATVVYAVGGFGPRAGRDRRDLRCVGVEIHTRGAHADVEELDAGRGERSRDVLDGVLVARGERGGA